MHILLLAEVFTPEPVVGAFRIRKLATAFAARGHQVTVVVARAGGSTESSIENVHLEVEPARQGPRDVYMSLRTRFAPSAASVLETGVATNGHPSGKSSAGFVRSFVTSAMNLPDDRQGVIPALLRGVRNVEHRGPFDLLYSSAPAFSVQLAARLAARRLGLPWFIEFRDPWRSNGGDRPAQRNAVVDRLDAYLEAACLRAATAVVAVSSSAAEAFRSKTGPAKPVLVALNGIEHMRTAGRAVTDRQRCRIVYAGSLYPPRDPRPLLQSIGRCVERGLVQVPEFVFVGHCHEYDGESLQSFAERHNIASHFRMISWLPQREAQELVSSADLALLPAQNWTEQIPNKLFDYLGSRVPILALASSDSETAKLLRKVGGHFVVESADAPDIDNVVLSALQKSASHSLAGDADVLSSLTVDAQFRSLTDDIERIMSARSNGRHRSRA